MFAVVIANRRQHRRESYVKKKKKKVGKYEGSPAQKKKKNGPLVTPATSRHREPFPPLINTSCDL